MTNHFKQFITPPSDQESTQKPQYPTGLEFLVELPGLLLKSRH